MCQANGSDRDFGKQPTQQSRYTRPDPEAMGTNAGFANPTYCLWGLHTGPTSHYLDIYLRVCKGMNLGNEVSLFTSHLAC